MFDVLEFVKRIIKYLVEGLMVAIAAYAIPKRSLNIEEIGIPTVGVTTRAGAGFGIGANLVGFPGGL